MVKFIVYGDELDALKELTNEEIGILIRAEAKYIDDEIEPELPLKLLLPFRFLAAHVMRDQKKYKDLSERRSAAGKKGAEAKHKKQEHEIQEQGESKAIKNSASIGEIEFERDSENKKCEEEKQRKRDMKRDMKKNTDNHDSYFADTKSNGAEESFQKYLEEMAESEYSKGDSRYKAETEGFEGEYREHIPEIKEIGFDEGPRKYLEEMAESEYSKGDSRYKAETEGFEGEYGEYIPENSEASVIKSVPHIPDIFIEPRNEVNTPAISRNIEVDTPKESPHGINGYRSFQDSQNADTSKEGSFGRNVRMCFEEFWEAYPKKIEKNCAAVEYMSMFTGEKSHFAIMNALNNCKKSEQWKEGNGKLIPLPRKWLSDLKSYVNRF